MASCNCGATAETSAPQGPTVIFRPFTWHHRAERCVDIKVDAGRVAEFAGGVRDVSAGVRHVMSIIERDDIEADSVDTRGRPIPALLSIQVKADLLRLAVFALTRLEADSAKMVDYLDDQAAA